MMMRMVLAVALVLAGLGGSAAYGTQTDNRGLHAVPAPGKVVIDGKLEEWDLSGQILICYDLETLKDVYSAKVAMMYDAEALYVGIDWRDLTPLGNSHDPRFTASRGWAGDAIQMRMKTDRISHLTAWYHGATNSPYIGIDYGKDLTHPFGGGSKQLFKTEGWKLDEGAEMAFAKKADGKGYYQEIKIPWKLITLEKVPKAGETFRCGFEMLWGEGDWPSHRYADNLDPAANNREFFWTSHNAWGPVTLEAKGHLALPEPAYMKALQGEEMTGPVEISYELAKDARVTVAIDDAAGVRVRNLIAALPRKAGKNTEKWDGLDDNGQAVAAGAYKIHAMYHEGIHVNYVMSFANSGDPTWATDDGKGAFYGDHTAPHAAAAGGDYVALACPLGESGKHLICCDLEGHRQWGLGNRTGFVIGTGSGRASLATDGTTLWVSQDGDGGIYRVELKTGKYSPWNRTVKDAGGRDVPVLDLKLPGSRPEGADKTTLNLAAIAVQRNVLAAALFLENKILLLDAGTGDLRATLDVPAPTALVFDSDGTMLAVSKGALVRVTQGGKISPFAAGDFAAGFGLAVDGARNVYLSVRGAEQVIKVFAPDGKLVREIGKKGGRPLNGPFDELGLRNPGQIAIDAKNHLWVTEETNNPKRTSVWNLDGTFVRDFVGTTSYAGAGSINPDDPTIGFADDTVYKIDLAKGTWRPIYSIAPSAEQLFHANAGSRARIFNRGDETVVFTAGRGSGVSCLVGRNNSWKPAAAVGVVAPKTEAAPLKGHIGEFYAWADKNGDGIVQDDELAFAKLQVEGKPAAFVGGYWGTLPGPDGTITLVSGKHVLRLPVVSWTASGAPVYDLSKPEDIVARINLGEGSIMGGSAGRTYFNASPLTALDAAGKVLFTYPSRNVSVHGSHTASSSKPGYLIGPSSILGTADFGGEIGEVFDMNGNLGENYLFTSDGLYIQTLFKDTRGWFDVPSKAVRGMSMDAITAGGESFGGFFARVKGGKTYLIIGTTDARVLEVTGLETIHRFSGSIDYTPALFAAAQKQLQDKAAGESKVVAATIARAKEAPAIDGKLADWPALAGEKPGASSLVVGDAAKPVGYAAASYDDKNLYVAWRVTSANGALRNAGQDNRLLFKTGDCVDVMIGAAEGGAKSPGNRRLLISMLDKKPVAVVYQPVAPGTAEKNRVPFASPWRSISFDRVEVVADVKIGTGAIAGGYVVEAAIPWTVLGVTPKAGLALRGDFGILSGDSGGTTTVARSYWCNKATNLVNDVPGEAELTPGQWGMWRLE